jgi:hypothetical protein
LRSLILTIGITKSNIVLNLSGIFYLPINIGGKFIMISFHSHESYRELILYLPNDDLELYSHSFQFVSVTVILSSDQR